MSELLARGCVFYSVGVWLMCVGSRFNRWVRQRYPQNEWWPS